MLTVSMVFDVYLSVLPHLAVAGASVWLYGFSLKALTAFMAPHLVLFVGALIKSALSGGGSPPSAAEQSLLDEVPGEAAEPPA